VDAGCAHSCTILDTGDLKCWGRGGHGEAGRGSFSTVGDQPEGMGNGLRLVP
jgi:alpha-tubulin suppressor-like RCC1 family protein